MDGDNDEQRAIETGCWGGQGSPRAVAPRGWNCTTSLMAQIFPPLVIYIKELCLNVSLVLKLIHSLDQLFVEMFPLQTINVAYFQRKIQLSVISAYPDGPSSQLIRISGDLLYMCACGGLQV